MIVVEAVLMILVPCLLGEGALRLLYGNHYRENLTRADSVLTGGMIVIGLAETVHLGAVIFGRSFSDCTILFCMGLVVLLIAAVVILVLSYRQRKQDKTAQKETEKVFFLVFGVLVLIQLALLETGGKIYPTGDMTVESVNTMLTTNTIYRFNPMTGQAYNLGMPLRLKILSLPTLYAILCQLFHTTAIELVWGLMPLLVLLGCYAAYYTLAKALFAEDKKKQAIFLVFVALILWAGNYMYGMDGFGMQYAGYRAVSIRALILVPYTISLILRKKWKIVPLCILAEACIMWTLYGMGACLLVTVALLLTGILRKRFVERQGGEGDSR